MVAASGQPRDEVVVDEQAPPRVRYADTKAGLDVTALLLAPWPETLWAFRRIWDSVSAVGRVVAIDIPGFG
jgi:hypothetical protein